MGTTGPFSLIGLLNLVSPIMLIACLYFVLMYLQHLKDGEERLIKQSRLAAVICLAIALLVPALFNILLFM